MRTMTQKLTTLGVIISVAAAWSLSAEAAPLKTPSPEQAQFYEQLKSGKRPAGKKALTAATRRALDASPVVTSAAQTTTTTTTTAVAAATTTASPSTAVYFSAHPDDFVLFMNPHRDVVRSDTKVVFVLVTAGDAGEGKGPRSAPYYLARENGAFRAIRFMADASNATVASPTTANVKYNGHYVRVTTYKNTTTVFMRLPDGAGEGSGYPVHNWASLMKLKTGEVSTITAVDGSTTYKGWSDLVKTLTEIVRGQAARSPNVWLDTHEIDATANPGDHSDHVATGLATAAVQTALPCTGLAYHVGYANSGLVNLDLVDIENRSGSFANYTSGLAELGYPGVSWEPTHMSWLAGMVNRLLGGNGQTCYF